MPLLVFSQKRASKSFVFSENEIEIDVKGLDDLVIENSNSEQLQIFLSDENIYAHDIIVSQENSVLKIKFIHTLEPQENSVFRKFITKRLHRASVLIKVPTAKSVQVFGRTVGINSKSYKGNLAIHIDKGNLNFGEVKGNTSIELFSGTIKATVLNKNIAIASKNGVIFIDNKTFKNEFKQASTSEFFFKLKSINANVILTTKKTQ